MRFNIFSQLKNLFVSAFGKKEIDQNNKDVKEFIRIINSANKTTEHTINKNETITLEADGIRRLVFGPRYWPYSREKTVEKIKQLTQSLIQSYAPTGYLGALLSIVWKKDHPEYHRAVIEKYITARGLDDISHNFTSDFGTDTHTDFLVSDGLKYTSTFHSTNESIEDQDINNKIENITSKLKQQLDQEQSTDTSNQDKSGVDALTKLSQLGFVTAAHKRQLLNAHYKDLVGPSTSGNSDESHLISTCRKIKSQAHLQSHHIHLLTKASCLLKTHSGKTLNIESKRKELMNICNRQP